MHPLCSFSPYFAEMYLSVNRARLRHASCRRLERLSSLSLVPRVRGALPVVRLSNQKAPVEFVKDVLTKLGVRPEATGPLSRVPELSSRASPLPDYLVGAMLDKHLVGYCHERSGDAESFPPLARQKPITIDRRGQLSKRASGLARQIFSRCEILAKDATRAVVGQPFPLLGTTAERTQRGIAATKL